MTSQAELEHVAFELFEANGFEQTTVEDIAMAAGIGRRTFFRYFPSKNDVPWGMFELELERMRTRLKACPGDVQLMDAIRLALVDFNQVEPAQIPGTGGGWSSSSGSRPCWPIPPCGSPPGAR